MSQLTTIYRADDGGINNRLSATFIRVTPSVAEELMRGNVGNRPLRRWWIAALSRALQRGEWIVTHQGVAFRHDGTLIDGQHRLSAIIDAGVPAEMLVVTGLPDNAFMAIDNGIKRSMSDLTGMSRKAAETCRLLASYCFFGVISPTMVLDVAKTGVLEIHDALIEHCGSSRAYYASAPMRASAIISVMDGQDMDYVFTCYKTLVTDDFTAMSDLMFSLVRQVNKGTTNALNKSDVFARGLKLFNKNNSRLSMLKISDSEISEAPKLVRSIINPLLGKASNSNSPEHRAKD